MIETIQKHIGPGPAVKLAQGIEGLVRSGKIPAESLLPPVRELARALRVSPGTAAAAYRTLRQQGMVTTDGRRGTRVLPRPGFREYAEPVVPPGALDLQVANPDPELLPPLGRFFSSMDASGGTYGADHLDADLAKRMRKELEADGIPGDHLVATSGALGAIYRALRVSLSPGDKVAVEDPGYNEHHGSAAALSLVALPVNVDDQGMQPESLRAALRAGASAVIVTPRFQNPTGAAFSPARAAALRALLAEFPAATVIVDDYASHLSEWPYHDCVGRRRDRWLVVRSFNKSLAPDLRVGVAAGDAATIERIRREQWLCDGWVSTYLQRAAAAALADRGTQALLARARRTYAERRAAFLRALARHGIRAQGPTGLNAWVPVADEVAIVQGLLQRGACVRAGARYRLRSPPAIRVTTARLLPERAERLAEDLRKLLRGNPVGRGP
jgi:DNA-binding transcriptional MocR family regulator